MSRKILLVLCLGGAFAIAGCKAQDGGGARGPVPGVPPQALPDVAVVEVNSVANTIAALANDIDPSGTGLTITAVQVDQAVPPVPGAVVSTDGATVSVTPAANFIGVLALQYTIVDGTGASASGVIAVTVAPVALGPVALPDAATVLQDSGATDIDVLANDLDLAGGGLTLTGASVTASLPPAAHALAVVGDQVRFTPAAGFIGAVLVGYTLSDVNGDTAVGVLTVVVSPLAPAIGPVPVPDALVVTQNSGATDVDVLANDVDPAGGGLTVTAAAVTASVPGGLNSVAIAANQVRFTPAAGFVGSVVVTYTATDIDGNAADGVLTVVVSALALPVGPVPLPDAAVVAQDSGVTAIDVLANDVDFVGGGLSLGGVAVTLSVPAAAHGLAVFGNEVRFAPAPGFAGVVVVGYTATDAGGNSAPGVLSIVVTPLALPVGPVPLPDAAVVAQDSGATDIDVLANDVDFAAGGLTLGAVSVFSSLPSATHAVAIAGNQVRFTPAAGFAGVVVVSYTATDVNGLAGNGLLGIQVTPTAIVLGPLALPDVGVASSAGGPVLFNVLANDIDPAGGGLTLTAAGIDVALPPGAGTVAIVGNQVRYTPALLYVGTVVIGYTAADSNGNTTVGVLSLTVTL